MVGQRVETVMLLNDFQLQTMNVIKMHLLNF